MPAGLPIRLMLCAALVAVGVARAEEPLTTVAAVRGLKPAALAAHRPVVLSGVVTYLRELEKSTNFILDDGTGGVMVYPQERQPLLRPGQHVTIEGVTERARLLLSITPSRIVVGDAGMLPAPVPSTLSDILAGRVDGRFLEIEEVVRVVRIEDPQLKPQRLSLDLGPRGGRVNAWISNWEGTENRFSPGTRARLRGVAVRWHNDRSQPVSTSLLINSPADITVLPSGAPIAPQPLAEVLLWTGIPDRANFVTTSGTVTYHRPGALLFLDDGERAIRCKPAPTDSLHAGQRLQPAKPGDRVEVSGFPAMGDYTTELEDAWVRVLDSPGIPAPTPLADAGALLAAQGIVDRDARSVTLAGTVRDVRERDGRRAIEMTSAGHDFTAWLPLNAELFDSIQASAVVRVTGICTLTLSEEARRFGKSPDGFTLLLAGREGIEVVRPAPWWKSRYIYGVIGASAGIACLAAIWALFLRQRNAILRREIAARRTAEARLASERRRVAADLHDTLEQTLIAANLQLTIASRVSPEPTNQSGAITLAQQLLGRGQQEVRDAVWDLHMDNADPQPLSAMLARACAEAASLSPAKVDFVARGPEQPLAGMIGAQAVRLVREAVTNALKHAKPRVVEVTCEFDPTQLRLCISDDGCGFKRSTAAGPESGHFGLTGMKERVQRLNGSLEVTSAPGKGTMILATIPLVRA